MFLFLMKILTDAQRTSTRGKAGVTRKGWCHQGVHPPAPHATACRVLAGIELITAFYGCLYAGCIPVTVRPPHAQSLTATLPTVRMIVEVSNGAVAESEAQALFFQPLRFERVTWLSKLLGCLNDSTDAPYWCKSCY